MTRAKLWQLLKCHINYYMAINHNHFGFTDGNTICFAKKMFFPHKVCYKKVSCCTYFGSSGKGSCVRPLVWAGLWAGLLSGLTSSFVPFVGSSSKLAMMSSHCWAALRMARRRFSLMNRANRHKTRRVRLSLNRIQGVQQYICITLLMCLFLHSHFLYLLFKNTVKKSIYTYYFN